MKKVFLFVISLLALLIFCGCRSTGGDGASPSVTTTGQGEMIVKGIISADYDMFASGANEKSNKTDEENFIRSCRELEENFGKMEAYRSMGELETPLLINQLYAVRFIRTSTDCKKVAHEQLLQLIFSVDDKQSKLLGMRFL